MPLARALAHRHRPAMFDREELEAAAYMALVEAAKSFDPAREVRFATYARHHIRFRIRESLGFHWDEAWSGEGGEAPVFHRLAHTAELHGWVIGKQPVPEVGAVLESADEVEGYLRCLPPLHAQACRFLYIQGKSREEAAALLGCSSSYLSRVHRDAIELLVREHGRDLSFAYRVPCATAS
jgi:RNA polymerase sigma factor (sigma-70 family)